MVFAVPEAEQEDSAGSVLLGGVKMFVQTALICLGASGAFVLLVFGIAELQELAPSRVAQEQFAEQYPGGRIASQIEHIQDGLTFTALVDGVVHRCVASAAGDDLVCATGEAE